MLLLKAGCSLACALSRSVCEKHSHSSFALSLSLFLMLSCCIVVGCWQRHDPLFVRLFSLNFSMWLAVHFFAIRFAFVVFVLALHTVQLLPLDCPSLRCVCECVCVLCLAECLYCKCAFICIRIGLMCQRGGHLMPDELCK